MEHESSREGKEGHVGDLVRLGILTVSDRASQGVYEDEGGPAILSFFEEAILSPFIAHYRCVKDDQAIIETAIKSLVDDVGCNVVVTTGGTGPAERDVTPEATTAVCDRIMPGFGEQMRSISLAFVPTAILSRQVGGLRGSSLIFNLPGRPKAIRETIDEIWKSVPYCIDLMNGPYMDMDEKICNSFRPKGALRS
ncbi:MAG: molybdopterin adenylyltransferase [Euryarchaeota archaeon]|nr:molybdopterin adenylyltransferase [Euryarchaeota archaeon]|tara:strand:- start:1677 stop:2261 length:585 start_codon:yes stop_codon:yes gene_type:complete